MSKIGKTVYFIEEDIITAGIVIQVCKNKNGQKKYVAAFLVEDKFESPTIQQRALYKGDLFAFNINKLAAKVTKKAEIAKKEIKQLRKMV